MSTACHKSNTVGRVVVQGHTLWGKASLEVLGVLPFEISDGLFAVLIYDPFTTDFKKFTGDRFFRKLVFS